jgi:hypothetical protein
MPVLLRLPQGSPAKMQALVKISNLQRIIPPAWRRLAALQIS